MKYLERFAVQPDTRMLVSGTPDPVDIFEIFVQLYKKCFNNILVIKKENKLKICVIFNFRL